MGQQLTEKQMTNGDWGLERWITVWIIWKIVFFHLTSLEDFSCRVWGATVETDLGGEISKPKVSRSIHWYTALLSHTRWSFLVVGSPAPSIRTLVIRGNRRTSGRIWVATNHRLWQHAVAWIAEGGFVNNSQCLYFVKPWKPPICFGRSKCCGRAVNTTVVVSCSFHPRQKWEARPGSYNPAALGHPRGKTENHPCFIIGQMTWRRNANSIPKWCA
jgi:hypothetical protein